MQLRKSIVCSYCRVHGLASASLADRQARDAQREGGRRRPLEVANLPMPAGNIRRAGRHFLRQDSTTVLTFGVGGQAGASSTRPMPLSSMCDAGGAADVGRVPRVKYRSGSCWPAYGLEVCLNAGYREMAMDSMLAAWQRIVSIVVVVAAACKDCHLHHHC